VGEKKPVEKSAVLVAFIVEHQCELLQLDNENIKISKNLDSKRQKIKSEAIEEVFVPKDLLGLIIGKGGSNLQYVKQEYGVGVHIIESSSEESQEYTETEIPEGKALIRVYGKDPKWVKQAVKDIFLQKVNITIEADKVAYCKGFQNQIVNDMKEKSGCVKVFIHEAEQGSEEAIIETIGNEDSLERLRMLLDTHLSYFEDYRQKEDVNRDLNKQMNKLNQNYGGGYYPNDANKSQGPSQRRGKKQWNQ
jgi:predicted PilT family ATPase